MFLVWQIITTELYTFPEPVSWQMNKEIFLLGCNEMQQNAQVKPL
jgi:hypothetical protein